MDGCLAFVRQERRFDPDQGLWGSPPREEYEYDRNVKRIHV
jgi:hypothetical protein